MRKTTVSRSPAAVAGALAAALLTALLAGCPQPTNQTPKSGDATLKSLSLKTGETSWQLSPDFNSETTEYTANVPTETENVEILAETNHEGAAVTSAGAVTLSGAGETTVVTVDVIAEDGETEKAYAITVYRAAAADSSNNNLESLSVSGVTLAPAFSADERTYSAQVPYETETVTIAALAADSETAKIDGAGEKTLAVGENIFTITVTAQSKAEKVYTVIITRRAEGEPPPPDGSDATLKSLALKTGEIPWSLAPDFAPGTAEYTVNVPTETENAEVLAETRHGGAGVTGTGAVTLNGAGETTVITVEVTSEDGETTIRYVVTVHRAAPAASANNDLESLSVSGVTLSPAFSAGALTYSALVPYGTASVIITAAAADSEAVLAGTGEKTLAVGENPFAVTVTAQSGAQKVYTIIITREDASKSDATLKSLALKTGTATWSLSPAFAPGTTQYTVNVPTNTSSVTIQAVPNHGKAKAVPVGGALNGAGETTPVYIDVTAEDGETKIRYVITIHRAPPAASTNNNLGNLTVSSGTLVPPFSASLTNYTLRLPHTAEIIVIGAVAADSATATLTGAGTKTLDFGENTAAITVVAQSGAEKVYTVVITREMDARLATLSAAPHTLDPPFDPDTFSYALQVTFDVAALPLTYTAKTAGAEIRVAGNVLYQGANAVTLTVTTSDGTEKTYTLMVSKAANPNGSPDNALKTLSLRAASGSHASNVPVLDPAFAPETLSYTVTGWTNGTNIVIDAEKNHELAILRGAGPRSLNVGDNALSLTVTAENGAVRTYTINVRRKSNDASIGVFDSENRNTNAAIVHSDGGLWANIGWEGTYWGGPPVPPVIHADGSVERHITALNNITWAGVRVSPAAGATVTAAKLNDAADITARNGNEYIVDPLAVGDNKITLTVTAEDGVTTQNHIYIINKEGPPPNTDATLKSIEVTGAQLAAQFNPAVASYWVYAGSETTSVTITAEKNDPKATLAGEDGEGKKTATVDLPAIGDTGTAEFTVTAENTFVSKTYTVTVIRVGAAQGGSYDNLSLLQADLAMMPANTVETPYPITLASTLSFADLGSSQASLWTALNGGGKYVTIDMSGLTGTPGNGADASTGRAYLVGVTLPASITAIPQHFFRNCTNLTAFDWSGLVSIGNNAFRNTGLSSLTLPSTITSVGTTAFNDSSKLVTADLSAASLTTVNMGWFTGCQSLATLVLPASATTFSGSITTSSNLDSLKTLHITAGISAIPASFFNVNFRPEEFTFTVAEGNTKYSAILDGKALASTEGATKTLMFYPSASGVATVPNDITAIAANAFRQAPITGIVLGSGLTDIADNAFTDCASLEGTITIPAGITTINKAFAGAGTGGAGFGLVLHSGVTSIATDAFCADSGGTGLTSITMPSSITSIGAYAFYETKLASIDLSALTITTLPTYIFYGCASLASVTLPPNLTHINSNAFQNCAALAGIVLPETLTNLGAYAFNSSTGGLTSVILPKSVSSVGNAAFRSPNLQWVKLLKDDGAVTVSTSASNFQFAQSSSAYPLMYVPDALYVTYAGDAEANPPVVSTWGVAGARQKLRPMSMFATDFPGQ